MIMSIAKRYLILDFYVDEPACFGVPPFVSPYPRYVYGALIDAGVNSDMIDYLTVDDLRLTEFKISGSYRAVFMIGGAVVPGKYLGQKIGNISEIEKALMNNRDLFFVAGGLAALQIASSHDNLQSVNGDIEQYAYDFVSSSPDISKMRLYKDLDRWALAGAGLVKKHPHFPNIICEIETYRGCPRSSHCSFCSEHIFKNIVYREQQNILAEIDALIEADVSRFRIGRQADILAYKSPLEEYIDTFPRPCVHEVVSLFEALEQRKKEGKISVLNVDNANPGTISHFENESFDILQAIASAVTPGDTLPLGVESLDPVVISRNNLKVDAETLIRVVRLMNSAGGHRENGIPKLLPGVNLIHGLPGETINSFRYNYETLMQILSQGLLLRRINIRSLVPFPTTGMVYDAPPKVINRYRYFRQLIRDNVDAPMLRRVFPSGSLLGSVRAEEIQNGTTYCRQIASYAITVKIKEEIKCGTVFTAAVCGHEPRSLRAFRNPLNINRASAKLLESVEGIGKRRAGSIVLNRPYENFDQCDESLSSVPELLKRRIDI